MSFDQKVFRLNEKYKKQKIGSAMDVFYQIGSKNL